MAKQEFEAERLLKRLESLDVTSPQRDPAKAETALRALYAAVQQPFPEFRWVPQLQDTLLEPMRAGWARYCAAGAPRTPNWTFQGLYEAVLASRPTDAFRGAWFNSMKRFEMRCGNEPREFVNKIAGAGDRAFRAAMKALDSEKLQKLQESGLRKAAELVVTGAEGVPQKDTVPAMLHLIDAIDAGLWFFWPGTEAVIAVARPKLSN
jgi:hypothetical protein